MRDLPDHLNPPLPRQGRAGTCRTRTLEDVWQAGCEASEYLMRIARTRPDFVAKLTATGPDLTLKDTFETLDAFNRPDLDLERLDLSRALRDAKLQAHAAIALADLAGLWPLEQVTGALSDFADLALRAALNAAAVQARNAGWIGQSQNAETEPVDAASANAHNPVPGFFCLALGKHGARELNFSSDIDIVFYFDPDRFIEGRVSAKEGVVRLTREVVRLIDARDEYGYVQRVDLRLRPDPGSTQIAMSVAAAERYYEQLGQNWERAVLIKARPIAGDRLAAQSFLDVLEPFIWRRHLDYWAIADIHSIKRQIHSAGGHGGLEEIGFDVKLGRGGIREIEFYAQTQQLILGGRYEHLRQPGTVAALEVLTAFGAVDPDTQRALEESYRYLRAVEHRIQMVADEQTHTMPADRQAREALARLCGYGRLDDFDADVLDHRQRVHDAYIALFAQEERLSDETGNLVFTGVDDDPDTLKTLARMGFSDPSAIISRVRDWHRGKVKAARSARGREILTRMVPRLLADISATGEPDTAFQRLDDFLGGVTAGVQTLSLMMSEPALCRELIRVMVLAPRLARDLASRPAVLDAMMDPHFFQPVAEDEPGARARDLMATIDREDGFEGALNAARRFHREEAFRIGYQVMVGRAGADAAGKAFAELADACIIALARAAEQEVSRRDGPAPGRWLVCGLGKLGGRELSAGSDLDLLVIYEAEAEGAQTWFTRFTQRLIAALSAPTEEGGLYEVDMQLRPSGRSGPVAVQISAFERYYLGEAWTWERMALTRLRVVAGSDVLARTLDQAMGRIFAAQSQTPENRQSIITDACDMRQRLARDRPGNGPWDLKLNPGGMVDIEFVAQVGQLLSGRQRMCPGTIDALRSLAETDWLTQDQVATLIEALTLQLDLQHILRLTHEGPFKPDRATQGLRQRLAKVGGLEAFSELEARLFEVQAKAADVRREKIGPLATE
jgi:glutamate-ammonia-ligase adenylyltransferase